MSKDKLRRQAPAAVLRTAVVSVVFVVGALPAAVAGATTVTAPTTTTTTAPVSATTVAPSTTTAATTTTTMVPDDVCRRLDDSPVPPRRGLTLRTRVRPWPEEGRRLQALR